MIIKYDGTTNKVQFVYEFFTQDKYATSPWFALPSMGCYVNHAHPWVVLMRESQRIFSTNWQFLNLFLQHLQEYYQEVMKYNKTVCFEACKEPYPSKEQCLAFWKQLLGDEEYENCMYGWFFHPDDYNK